MRSILLGFLMFNCTFSFSQESLSQENGKIIIDIFMNGYRAGDTLKMKSVMHPNMTMQIAYLTADQQNALLYMNPANFLVYAATTSKDQMWEQNLKDYFVQSDGNIAHVWTPFEFYKDGKFSYCGVDSYTLVYTDESWKILNIISSRRIGSCKD